MAAAIASAGAAEEIPFHYDHNLIWIKLDVQGRKTPLNFLLDTGAGTTVLNIQTAAQLGLKFGDAESVQGVNSRSTARKVSGFHASVAGVPVRESLLAVDLCAASCSCQRRIDGLLGADFLRNRIVQIDYAAGKIRLMDRFAPVPAGGEKLSLRQQNDGFCLPVSVCGGSPQWVRLDTGCDEALHWVTNRPDRLKNVRVVTIGLSGMALRYAQTDIRLGNESFHDVKTGIQRNTIFPCEAGLLGNGLLSKFKVTIDVDHRTLILQRERS